MSAMGRETDIAAGSASKDGIVRAASLSKRQDKAFGMEAAGVKRVCGVGLKFDDAGKLVGASISLCPP